jgi:16S rRNA A1518/A1519 N6-dimethyltransferase RsmA/KsgA/DIM1 with predicted DNA glycosylase/AP lyase activity
MARRVTAVEFDREMVNYLQAQWPENGTHPGAPLTIVQADVLIFTGWLALTSLQEPSSPNPRSCPTF